MDVQIVRWPGRGTFPGIAAFDQRLPSAVRRSSSTERISEPFCSVWLLCLRLLVVVELAFDPVVARWKRLTVDQSRSSRSGSSRVSAQSGDQGIEISATAPAIILASGNGLGSGSSWKGR